MWVFRENRQVNKLCRDVVLFLAVGLVGLSVHGTQHVPNHSIGVSEIPLEIEGIVLGQTTEWYDGRRILTRYVVEVERIHHGTLERSFIEVVLPGGEVGDVVQYIPGVPKLQLGAYAHFMLKAPHPELGAYTLSDWVNGYQILAVDQDEAQQVDLE